jgi:hypothetical protein
MIDAKFEGTCSECDKKINIGDAIERADDMVGWRHVTCPVDTTEKPTKFQGTTLEDMGY